MSEEKDTEKCTEYITETEARTVKEMFKKYLKLYKTKNPSTSDEQWLEELFTSELPEMNQEEAKNSAKEIMSSIKTFDTNFSSCNEAAEKGVSKEKWLADKMQEASVGISVNEYGKRLQAMDDFLYQKNMELADALSRSSDGHIMMSPNLDGNIAENMIAKTTEMSGFLQGKNIKVDVLQSHNKNSVDVRVVNADTGKYQNYQLKFGKDADATTKLFEKGNYNNQRLIVPKEQTGNIQEHLTAKGSSKSVSDHIEAWGAEGKSFTKEEMKELQEKAQKEGTYPELTYSHYKTKDLAMYIGRNAGAMALQSAAVTAGLDMANKIFQGEKIDFEEVVEVAIKTGSDTAVKTITAGTLQVAIRKGIIKIIPKATPAGVIANIACVGIENVKILAKIASGDMSATKGLDQMGRVTTSMIGGLWATAKGAQIGAALTAWVPVVGPALAAVSGFVGGMVGYFCGSKAGNAIYNAGKKIAGAAKSVAKAAVNGLKSVGRACKNIVKSVGKAFFRR